MTTKALVIAATFLCSIDVLWAASFECPNGTKYSSAKKDTGEIEWCQRVGSDSASVNHGPFKFTGTHSRIFGNYVDGKKSGAWKMFSAQGELVSEVSWLDDKPNGKSAVYFSKQILESGTYVLGERHGVWNTWHLDGKNRSQANYENGKKVGLETLWDEQGRKVQQSEYTKDGLHQRTEFYPSGKKYTEELYVGGPATYQWQVWTDSGRLVLLGHYKDNHPSGGWDRWHKSGTLLRHADFSDGNVTHDSAVNVALDEPSLMAVPTATQKLSENATRRPFDPLGLAHIVVGAATLTSGIYSVKNIHPINKTTGKPATDSLGFLSIIEGGTAIVLGAFFLPFMDSLHFEWEGIKDDASTTHADRVAREREAETRLKRTHDGYRGSANFISTLFGLLNAGTFWHARNVRCNSCAISAAVATGISLTPLLTYFSRERRAYREFIESKKSVFSPDLNFTLAPGGEKASQYALGLKWSW